MKKWLLRRLGITPELIERAKDIESAARSRAETLPPIVNRRVLVLLPKEKYFAWKAQWEAHRKDIPRADDPILDRWANARAYLVDIADPATDLAPLVARYRRYFLDAFVDGHAPRSLWPSTPTEDEFPEWFEVQLVGWGVRDLGTQSLTSQPDLLVALGPGLGVGIARPASGDATAGSDPP
jgi:hypothetical protein